MAVFFSEVCQNRNLVDDRQSSKESQSCANDQHELVIVQVDDDEQQSTKNETHYSDDEYEAARSFQRISKYRIGKAR